MPDLRRKRRVTYVTDLELTPSGGGAYAVNWHAFNELGKRFDAHYAGPIVPQPPAIESAISKIRRRILGRPGNYTYFSPDTLESNARAVEGRIAPDTDCIVFRSAGRWARCKPAAPYFVYLDAVVHTFFHNTFDADDFQSRDLERIWREEAAFLNKASGVFFESHWALDMAESAYGLSGDNCLVAGRGGVIDPPSADVWTSASHSLVTMAMDFRQKGGDIAADAYRRLKPRFPSLEWHIIGGAPGASVETLDGVTWEGVLDPDDPRGRARLSELLSSAFLCLHATREDTSPLVITEAAYFGCPTVSVNMFAIPELVLDGRTGVLLEPPVEAEALAGAIEALLLDKERYERMRREARNYSLANFQWSRTGSVICDDIDQVLG